MAASSATGHRREVDALRYSGVMLGDQVAVHRLRQIWRERREQLRQRLQAGIQRGIRGLLVGVAFAFPEAAAITAHIPVRQLLYEALDALRRRMDIVVVQVGGDIAHEPIERRQCPAVDRL